MNFESTKANDMVDDNGPASLPTMLPAPPRIPAFLRVVSLAAHRGALALVASNPHPSTTKVTIPNLRIVRGESPSTPPPSIPPTGSTPIRRAA